MQKIEINRVFSNIENLWIFNISEVNRPKLQQLKLHFIFLKNLTMKIYLIVCISFILICCHTPENKKEVTAHNFDRLTALMDKYAENSLQNGNINSIALAVYRNGEMYHNYYGGLETNSEVKPNDTTLYEIASITKVFAGSLAARAVVDGKINIDDDIRKYLKGDYSNLEYENTPITIKNLLTHTLGLKYKTPPGFKKVTEQTSEGYYEDNPYEYNIDNLLEELKTVTLDKKPGTFYVYNSVGPELVAYILEQVYQKPYEEQLNLFLKELDMNDTYLLDATIEDKVANGYNSDGKIVPLSKNPLLGAAAGMISTLPDLMKFMKFQLENDDPLIKESTRILYEDDEDNTMGYLWQDMGTAKEEGFYYSKTGTSSGVQSGMLLCPDSNYGQIIIINNNSEPAFMDWLRLFNTIETDLIKYPKLNLKSITKSEFVKDLDNGTEQFNSLKSQDSIYFNTDLAGALNKIGYEFLYANNDAKKAILFFEYAVKKFPDDANLYDSLGEAFYVDKQYVNALLNYKKSLALNPENKNAENNISEISKLL